MGLRRIHTADIRGNECAGTTTDEYEEVRHITPVGFSPSKKRDVRVGLRCVVEKRAASRASASRPSSVGSASVVTVHPLGTNVCVDTTILTMRQSPPVGMAPQTASCVSFAHCARTELWFGYAKNAQGSRDSTRTICVTPVQDKYSSNTTGSEQFQQRIHHASSNSV